MSGTPTTSTSEELTRIAESARRLGVELNEAEAARWLAAIAAGQSTGDFVLDPTSGVYGHRVAMLDFTPLELERFRQIGRVVEIGDGPGVETALALSGSAAQSKIQTHPGDCDYFERVNIHADSREAAATTLARVIREKGLAAERGETYQLIAVRFGSATTDLVRNGAPLKRGSSLEWTPDELRSGRFEAATADGEPAPVGWDEAAADPGWCKLDWIVADPIHGTLTNASNMLDVTWEAPDGSITPLDGFLDGYFQEIYLEADSVPLFSKLVRSATPDALDDYVAQLEREVAKYVGEHPNYGKAAKRMYNVFRLTARYPEAAYIRELFDEPAAVLYQVWSLIQSIDNAVGPESTLPLRHAITQADQLILQVVATLDGAEESEIVRSLLRLRGLLEQAEAGADLTAEVEGARAQVINVVNNFFRDRLVAVPTIRDYLAGFQTKPQEES